MGGKPPRKQLQFRTFRKNSSLLSFPKNGWNSPLLIRPGCQESRALHAFHPACCTPSQGAVPYHSLQSRAKEAQTKSAPPLWVQSNSADNAELVLPALVISSSKYIAARLTTQNERNESVQRLLEMEQRLAALGEISAAARGDHHHILNAHPEFSRQIQTGLDCHHHPLPQDGG